MASVDLREIKKICPQLVPLLKLGRKIADIKSTDKDYLEVWGGQGQRRLLIDQLGRKTLEVLPAMTRRIIKLAKQSS